MDDERELLDDYEDSAESEAPEPMADPAPGADAPSESETSER